MLNNRSEIVPFIAGMVVSALAILILLFLFTTAHAGEKTYGDVVGIAVSNYDGDTLTIDIPGMPPIMARR